MTKIFKKLLKKGTTLRDRTHVGGGASPKTTISPGELAYKGGGGLR